MLIFMTFMVALLFGALGGLLYHLQQPASEREGTFQLTWPGRQPAAGTGMASSFQLGVLGDCLYGAVGGLLLLALSVRLLGDYVTPIFEARTQLGGELFAAWLYLIATAVLGGYLGLRLLSVVTASRFGHWKRQLDQLRQDVQILEEELRESRAGLLMQEAVQKLEQGYFAEGKEALERALALTPGRARILAYLGYCKSFLAQEQNRVEGQEHVTLEQALQDLNEGIRLVEEKLDRRAEPSVTAALYYNRACVRYLKWRSQGRSPAKLTDEDIRWLQVDIERALRLDQGKRIWNQLLADCGLAGKPVKASGQPLLTDDFKELYEQSRVFKAYVQGLGEARESRFDLSPPFSSMASGLELEGAGA